MGEYINEATVLDFYVEEINKDNIKFLKGKESYKKNIAEEISKLKQENEMNEKIRICKNLWKLLFEASMSYIDPDKSGYDSLFKYFDEYVNFEELIFASDSFYRDHTMHCLWVYFLGEYIMRSPEFSSFMPNMNKIYGQIDDISNVLKSLPFGAEMERNIATFDRIAEVLECSDSIRCVNALTHDLGYPIKKISMINKSVKGIIPYFGLKSFSEFSFQYDGIQNNAIAKFIEFISLNFSFNFIEEASVGPNLLTVLSKIFDTDEKTGKIHGVNKDGLKDINDSDIELLIKHIRLHTSIMNDYSAYIRYSTDFEEYQHGIMSAFLLMRVLKCFENIRLSYSDYNNISRNDTDFRDVFAKKEILSSISDHTSDGYQISDISDHSGFLTFIDELEEFSRISRANQNRQYVNEFCKTNIYLHDGFFNIDFIFDNDIKNLDPEKSFRGKCKRFLSLFKINELDENMKIRFRCISRLPGNNNTYVLEIGRHYANILINNIEQDIPSYLKSRQYYTREEYMAMK